MKNVIKHGNTWGTLPEHTVECPKCGCKFTYGKFDVNPVGKVSCPECREDCSTVESQSMSAKDKLINTILSEFDFKKVKSIMDSVQWTWMNGVPEVCDLEYQAKQLLEKAYDNKTTAATGGFKAEYKDYTHEESLSLHFGIDYDYISIDKDTNEIIYY